MSYLENISSTCSMDELSIEGKIFTKEDLFRAIESGGEDSLSTDSSLKSILYNNQDRALDKQLKDIGFKKVAHYTGNNLDFKGKKVKIYTYILVLNNTFRREYNRRYKKNNE